MNRGMITPAARMKNDGDRTQDDQHDPEQRRGQPYRLFAPPLLEQIGEHRHERRRQGRVGEQVATRFGTWKAIVKAEAGPLVPK